MLVDNSKLFTCYYEDTKTLYEAFQRGLHITGVYSFFTLSTSPFSRYIKNIRVVER